jgi:carbon monoxide dehydrogenase subunit G
MAHIHEEIEIHAAPGDIWALAGDPGRIADWLPALSSSRAAGDKRECTMTNGAELKERILEHSDEERSYNYEIVDAPMPVRSYRSRLSVQGHDGHSHVHWEAEFEPEDAEQEAELLEMFTRTYRDGLESLRDRLEADSAA